MIQNQYVNKLFLMIEKSNLKKLELASIGLEYKEIIEILILLNTNKNLECLDLSSNCKNEKNDFSIEDLNLDLSIKELNLSHNYIDDKKNQIFI